ncbi:hypothetical protein AB0M95_39585 [Sphaerisporangium sp. NPDC051017]|uniref:hypothetical protein n=1 Tax=Sphaerisporangium sp. NPDC051017 TaxID=3154636 RepID=UPI00343E0228
MVRAVLFPVRDAPSVIYQVPLSRTSTQRARLGHRAGQTLGGVAELSSSAWAVVAYADRAHLLHGGGPVTFLADVDDLPTAVASLITIGGRPAAAQPLTTAERRIRE